MMRGLLLVEMILPKSLPAFKLLIGLAKLTLLKRLKNSVRNSMFLDSFKRKRLLTEKSVLNCLGPRRILRPTLPKSVQTILVIEHEASAKAAPPETLAHQSFRFSKINSAIQSAEPIPQNAGRSAAGQKADRL